MRNRSVYQITRLIVTGRDVDAILILYVTKLLSACSAGKCRFYTVLVYHLFVGQSTAVAGAGHAVNSGITTGDATPLSWHRGTVQL